MRQIKEEKIDKPPKKKIHVENAKNSKKPLK